MATVAPQAATFPTSKGATTALQKISNLLHAAHNGDTFALHQALTTGDVDVNCVDWDLRGAMHMAAAGGHMECVKILLQANADPNLVDRDGNTPLDDAIKYNREMMISYLRDNGGQSSNKRLFEKEFITAAHEGRIRDLERYVKNGVNIDAIDADKRTALHHACDRGHADCVAFLMVQGANVGLRDKYDNTPLNDAERMAPRSGTDFVLDELTSQNVGKDKIKPKAVFPFAILLIQAAFAVLYGLFCDYDAEAKQNDPSKLGYQSKFAFFQATHAMVGLGFGLVFTFLRKYSFSGVGFTFLLIAVAFEWHILCEGFFMRLFADEWGGKIAVSITNLINADFAAASVAIAFGALLGKASPTQMLVLVLVQVPLFALNREIGGKLKVSDTGGSMAIHVFGAYFGVGSSMVMSVVDTKAGRTDNNSVYHSDMFSMLGTLFLWVFFPAFNSASAMEGTMQHRAIINTVIALTSSCVTAYAVSQLLRPERAFAMADIQTATIAGGVAIGTSCDMIIYPVGAFLTGMSAAIAVVVGFTLLQPLLERAIGFHDTAGIHNTHGIAGFVGGAAGAVAAAAADSEVYGPAMSLLFPGRVEVDGRTPAMQGGMQVAFMFVCLGTGLCGGLLAGFIAKLNVFDVTSTHFYHDKIWWKLPHLETPYYHDAKRDTSDTIRFEETAKEQPRSEVVVQTVSDPRMHEMMEKVDKILQAAAQQQLEATNRSMSHSLLPAGPQVVLPPNLVHPAHQAVSSPAPPAHPIYAEVARM